MNELEINEMAISSAKAAHDQQYDYESLADAFYSYENNAIETLVDLGIGTPENFEIVYQAFAAEAALLSA
jgi:hypothetical protein